MRDKSSDSATRDAFLERLRAFRDDCGVPSTRELERVSHDLNALYGEQYKGLPGLTSTAVSAILGGKRKGLPAWKWVASFVLCCQRLAFEAIVITHDPGGATLAQWHHWWRDARDQFLAPATKEQGLGNNPLPSVPETGPAATVPAVGAGARRDRYRELYGDHGLELVDTARAGDPSAAYRLGTLLGTSGHVTEALGWLGVAQAAGHRQATELIEVNASALDAAGHACDIADAIPSGDRTALLYYQRAADCGLIGAAVKLAVRYLADGDRKNAAYWFGLAAYRGDTLAQLRLDEIRRTDELSRQPPRRRVTDDFEDPISGDPAPA